MTKTVMIAFSALLGSCVFTAAQTSGGYADLADSLRIAYVRAETCPNCYYYIPADLRVSSGPTAQPELSLMTISETENDPVTGGIMHLLLVWGLSETREEELTRKLRSQVDSMAVIVGSVMIDNRNAVGTLHILGDDELARTLRAGLKNKSEAAVSPGAKMALSFRFDEQQIKTVTEYTAKKKKTDAEFAIDLNCLVTDVEGFGTRQVAVRLRLGFARLYPYFK